MENTKDVTIKLKDVHPDIDRYLEEDCYLPGEIYSPDGFFYQVFTGDHEVSCIFEGISTNPIAVVGTSQEGADPQVLLVTTSEDKSSVLDITRYDATENNIFITSKILRGEKPKEDEKYRLDEFVEGSKAKSLDKILSIADAIMVS